jgi:hypothetical protein
VGAVIRPAVIQSGGLCKEWSERYHLVSRGSWRVGMVSVCGRVASNVGAFSSQA